MQSIRQANADSKYCVVLWDNLPSHTEKEVVLLARKLKIILVNLPAYAPDLNPIERIWKQIKRIISYQGVVESKEKLSTIITEAFTQLVKSKSFANKWVEDIFMPIFRYSPI